MPEIFVVRQHCYVIDLGLTAYAVKRPMGRAAITCGDVFLRGLGICPNKLFEEVCAEAEISKTSIPGQECPACEVVEKSVESLYILCQSFALGAFDSV